MLPALIVLLLAQDWQPPPRPAMRRGPDVAVVASVAPQPGPVLAFDPGFVSVTVSPIPHAAAERMLGKRVARVAMPWTVNLTDDSDGPVSIAEPAVLRRIPQLNPISRQAMSLLIDEGAANSAWARAGRFAGDVGKGTAFFLAAKDIGVGGPWYLGIASAQVLIPYAVSRFRGAERPVRANFEQLSWSAPIQLEPGGSASTIIYTAPWTNPKPVSFSIDTARVPMRRAIQ